MRISIVDTDYLPFLRTHYQTFRNSGPLGYAQQLEARRQHLFGLVEPYRRELAALGHVVDDIYLNDRMMQRAWAEEWNPSLLAGYRRAHLRLRRRIVPWLQAGPSEEWLGDLLECRIDAHRPDFVLVLNMHAIPAARLTSIRTSGPRIVGQHAATPVGTIDVRPFDLVVSSFPPTVAEVAARGTRADYVPLALDDRVLQFPLPRTRRYEVSFVGSLAPIHRPRRDLLAGLADAVPGFVWWSPQKEFRRRSRALRHSYMGDVWGEDMYRVLSESLVTINHHGAVGPYSNNLRLYEATGVGALLVTDQRRKLNELFDIGDEVLSYSGTRDCIEIVRSVLASPAELRKISRAGQQRTKRDHLWSRRIPQMMEIIEDSL